MWLVWGWDFFFFTSPNEGVEQIHENWHIDIYQSMCLVECTCCSCLSFHLLWHCQSSVIYWWKGQNLVSHEDSNIWWEDAQSPWWKSTQQSLEETEFRRNRVKITPVLEDLGLPQTHETIASVSDLVMADWWLTLVTGTQPLLLASGTQHFDWRTGYRESHGIRFFGCWWNVFFKKVV